MKYTVYYEIGNHKMKTEIEAINKLDAKSQIRDKLFFHRIEPMDECERTCTGSDILSFIKGFKK